MVPEYTIYSTPTNTDWTTIGNTNNVITANSVPFVSTPVTNAITSGTTVNYVIRTCTSSDINNEWIQSS